MKIAVNRCYGGFSLSEVAAKKLGLAPSNFLSGVFRDMVHVSNHDLGIESDNYHAYRADSRLIAVVEELGEKASGSCAELEIVEIPDDVEWEIEEYDGREWVSEQHRTW